MSKINDGGPAYPGSVRRQEKYMDEGGYGHTRTVQTMEGGMSLRDWFAGMALIGSVQHAGTWAIDDEGIAVGCWSQADAMLATREKERV